MPRVQMTPMVKMALYFLRAYLIILLILILIAFIRKSQTNSSVKPAAPASESPSGIPGRNPAL
jgi:hypothetical protein